MKYYRLSENELVINVKRAPLFVISAAFLFASLFLLLPLMGTFFALSQGVDFHFGFLIGIGLFGLFGGYMLKLALWSTFGAERIRFNGSIVTYQADYRLFKTFRQVKEISPLSFSAKEVGYIEDNRGTLVIGSGDNRIECVAALPFDHLEELIAALWLRYAD